MRCSPWFSGHVHQKDTSQVNVTQSVSDTLQGQGVSPTAPLPCGRLPRSLRSLAMTYTCLRHPERQRGVSRLTMQEIATPPEGGSQ